MHPHESPPPSLRLACLFAVLLFPARAQPAPAVSVPRLTHPGAGQTFYLLMPDRFANGRTDNDTGHLPGGPEENGFDPTRISHYHGGDFAGLTARLDYIKALGTTAIWTTPPFKNKPVQSGTAGYHGYWPLDFLNVDPHLGTNEEYREFHPPSPCPRHAGLPGHRRQPHRRRHQIPRGQIHLP